MGGGGPTFSILVPCYQRATLLPAALESAVAQERDGVEIIVVDDGSTDETYAVADGYRARHPDRIRVVRQENRGVTLARAAAFAIARGDYLVFLDSDDLLEPGMIATCRRALAGRPDADLLVGKRVGRRAGRA
jgi:glycosyltransferase involved in cell wall biosynthesis